MVYKNYSSHANTGTIGTDGVIVSPNEYAPEGKAIGYPAKLDVYVNQISDADGSQTVIERRRPADLQGNRLYLFHRPTVSAAGTVSAITTTDGVIDTTLTNAKQGYIVFSTNPTNSTFDISYTAAVDCFHQNQINVLQDSVMEIQNVLGITNNTGYDGLRNITFATFDNPDTSISGVATNALYMSYLSRDIVFGSRGASPVAHTITLGQQIDQIICDTTGFRIENTDATKTSRIELGTNTGDHVSWYGLMSGDGPLEVGGDKWPQAAGDQHGPAFSGTWEGLISGDHFSGSMLKVWGDASVMGGLQTVGPITVVHTTGQTSTILGDFTVRDELFVYGISHLIGQTIANRVDVQKNVYLDGDLIADNIAGAGGKGQTLIDNLDCSEVAHSYKAVTQRVLPNSIVSAPKKMNYLPPVQRVRSSQYDISTGVVVGDLWVQTGQVNANAGPSGAHPFIIQLNMKEKYVTGTYPKTDTGSANPSGVADGWWSPGIMDPGNIWIEILSGAGQGYRSPIYGYTVENIGDTFISGLNVFCPDGTGVNTNDIYMLYNPHAVPADFISTAGGSAPTFQVSGSPFDPLRISFEDEVRIVTALTPTYSLTTALNRSLSGSPTNQSSPDGTGIAYIFADSRNSDPEEPPHFHARPTPYRLPGETVVGEVVASKAGSTFTILDTVSYRPGGMYDSAWIPILKDNNVASGRCISKFTTDRKYYFNHQLGADANVTNTAVDVYLASFGNTDPATIWGDQVQSFAYSLQGADYRHSIGLSGGFTKVSVGNTTLSNNAERDASLFYMDGKVVGLEFTKEFDDNRSGSNPHPKYDYLRVVMRRTH